MACESAGRGPGARHGLGVEVHGHRGARGLAPENTLPGFARALAIGVSALELDVGVSRDGVVVVAHDRCLSPDLARTPDGVWLPAPGPRLRALNFEALRRYDVGRVRPGSDYARAFPEQVPADGARIPALAEVATLVRGAGDSAPRLNVEIKYSAEHPEDTLPPEPFADAVVAALRACGVAHRALIQCFDWRVIVRVRTIAPEVEVACLSAEQPWFDNLRRWHPDSLWTAGLRLAEYGGSVPRLVRATGASIWSSWHGELDAERVAEAHALGLAVYAWTVNDPLAMRTLIDLGVDGIITDYPDRLRTVMAELGLALPAPIPMPA